MSTRDNVFLPPGALPKYLAMILTAALGDGMVTNILVRHVWLAENFLVNRDSLVAEILTDVNRDDEYHLLRGHDLKTLIVRMIDNENVNHAIQQLINADHANDDLQSSLSVKRNVEKNDVAAIFLQFDDDGNVAKVDDHVHRFLPPLLLVLRPDGQNIETKHEHEHFPQPLGARPVAEDDHTAAAEVADLYLCQGFTAIIWSEDCLCIDSSSVTDINGICLVLCVVLLSWKIDGDWKRRRLGFDCDRACTCCRLKEVDYNDHAISKRKLIESFNYRGIRLKVTVNASQIAPLNWLAEAK